MSFTADGIAGYLGPEVTEALYRGEPGVVMSATNGNDALAGLIRFFLLRLPTSGEILGELIGHRLAASLIDEAFVHVTPAGEVQVAVDIRPHIIAGKNRVVFSDLDASVTDHVPGPDHVLGVGAASLSLLSATPLSPVDSVLDLGTGSGVQALAQADSAMRIVATDVHERALQMARCTMAGAHVRNVEIRTGSWFEPVEGESFDRIVANPPFVVGLPEVGHVYRDSGLSLDGATQLVVKHAPAHLNPNGTAYTLGAWVHTREESWATRIASWLPKRGVSAWVIQRDVADPGQYVSTWLKDESIDPRSRAGIERTQEWLEYFREEGVIGVGFGWIFLRDIGDRPTEVTCEEVLQPFTDPLGPEVDEYFERIGWLRDKTAAEILQSTYLVRPGVAREEVSLADSETGMGFTPQVIRLTRTDGPRFSHEVDRALASIVAGLHPQGLNLEETVGLWAAAQGIDDEEELASSAVSAVVDLIRHGLILPSDIATTQA
ncbi:class I SAM-dependent methyltransferase [Corynebacterium breve]|uniref:Class I SAM-dependent methyltransferase n=1 Tax=Corynebacterium breve TaxID=3049799 RepID=A0ABY8VJ84_9CORY|nr:class I SAM-dependent methyltransferase [Corynebacterium breve]WIM69036.1 class I SAM-dependent methyltransferase [Corynebacterium breve]